MLWKSLTRRSKKRLRGRRKSRINSIKTSKRVIQYLVVRLMNK
jgi:hypothetical protein